MESRWAHAKIARLERLLCVCVTLVVSGECVYGTYISGLLFFVKTPRGSDERASVHKDGFGGRGRTGRRRARALRKQLQDAQANIDAFMVSPEELRRVAAAAEALAFENGTSPKTSSVINSLKRRWEEFITKHGEAYGWSGTPTIDLAVHF